MYVKFVSKNVLLFRCTCYFYGIGVESAINGTPEVVNNTDLPLVQGKVIAIKDVAKQDGARSLTIYLRNQRDKPARMTLRKR